jgi:hypothetical protein
MGRVIVAPFKPDQAHPAKGLQDLAAALWMRNNLRICAEAEDGIRTAAQIRKHLEPQVEWLTKGNSHFSKTYLDAMLTQLLEAAIGIMGADMGNIQVLDPVSGSLHIEVQCGFREPFLRFFASVRDGAAACGTALKRAERVVIEDVAESPIFFCTPALEVLLDAGARAVQSTPLISSGRVWGVLSTHRRTPKLPTQRDLRLLDAMARRAAGLIERMPRNGGSCDSALPDI